MKEYKIVQKLNNLLSESNDLHCEISIDNSENAIIQYATDYFFHECPDLVYPGKSYAVAIIYALFIEKYFGEDFYISLNDPELLCSNDKYFKPYSASSKIYDQILENIKFKQDKFEINTKLSQIESTRNYFMREFNLG